MKTEQAYELAIKALEEKARRAHLFHKLDGSAAYQRCLEAIRILKEVSQYERQIPLFPESEE